MTWVLANVLSALIAASIIAYKLFAYPDRFNHSELAGMGMIGAAMIMRIGPILGNNVFNDPSPFDNWSTTLLHLGCAVYFVGRLLRTDREARSI